MTRDPRNKDNQDAQRYVLAIRNPIKRQYAGAWLGYRLGILEHRPEQPKTISYMAAQAVRMRIDVIVG